MQSMSRRSFLGSATLAGVALVYGKTPSQTAVQTTPQRKSHNFVCAFGIMPDGSFGMVDSKLLSDEQMALICKDMPSVRTYRIAGFEITTNISME